jgi:hypothetical protein
MLRQIVPDVSEQRTTSIFILFYSKNTLVLDFCFLDLLFLSWSILSSPSALTAFRPVLLMQ